MKLFKKKLIAVDIQRAWSTTWAGIKWTVHATYVKSFLGFHWNETYQYAGPFSTRQEAKRCAKHLRIKHNLK